MAFSSDVRKWSRKTQDNMNKVRRAASLELFRLIIVSTPVDNGILINNWRTQINRPNTNQRVTANTSGGDSLREAQGNLGTMKDAVYFSNNMPYAYRIEFDGWSKHKAPQGMVRKNTARWDQIVAAKAREYQ